MALSKPAPERSELEALLREAAARPMTPEERRAQRRSWVRGQMPHDMPLEQIDAILDKLEAEGIL